MKVRLTAEVTCAIAYVCKLVQFEQKVHDRPTDSDVTCADDAWLKADVVFEPVSTGGGIFGDFLPGGGAHKATVTAVHPPGLAVRSSKNLIPLCARCWALAESKGWVRMEPAEQPKDG